MMNQKSTNSFENPSIESHNNVIFVKGARVHNLKNVDVTIPKNNLIVVTGVSGSGKSSLTIDTIYAEGQRRYVESLSSYARQFLGRMNKPDVDYIHGLCPAIAIEQKVSTRSSRSTVGSMTEIYDYLRLLFARIGKTFSPISGKMVKKHEVNDVVQFVNSLKEESAVYILTPIKKSSRTWEEELKLISQKGFSRLLINQSVVKLEEQLSDTKKPLRPRGNLFVLIDRLHVQQENKDTQTRIADSVNTAFYEGDGDCAIWYDDGKIEMFSNRFELDGIQFEEPTPYFFSFNNSYGACKTCEGFGTVLGIDENLVIPDKSMSVFEGAISCWRGEKMKEWNDKLLKVAMKFDFPVHRAIRDLTKKQYQLLWTGNEYFYGLTDFFKDLEKQSFKIQYRVMLSRYKGRTICPDCSGTRIRKEVQYVKIDGANITELVTMPVEDLKLFFDKLVLSEYDFAVAKRILIEINNRIRFLCEVGLSYLTLNRLSSTLSGGETQRINLTRTVGSNLTSSLYILDEPSVGLHPHDTGRLLEVLKHLRNLGNTVIVVEHEEEIMRQADEIIDVGPAAGIHGGEIIFSGNYNDLLADKKSLTADYLTGRKEIAVPKIRRPFTQFVELTGASENNLQNVSAKFPLNVLTVVTGVSGSGKTTLIKKILYPAWQQLLGNYIERPGSFRNLKGDIKSINQIEWIDQNPLGKSSRSNPVTYIKAYDAIRDLYAAQHLSAMRGYKSKHFSFNVEGGRCEHCKGEGEIVVEMQFLADVHLTCDECHGQRFQEEVLEVQYKGKNIFDVLSMSVDEAIEFFWEEEALAKSLQPLADVGLGYVKLGQSSSTLSGGEAQRVKLASFLGKGESQKPVLFIFDEPTTGLHFHDINKLLKSFYALIERGHSVLVIEHNVEIIKCADWVIDLGPAGGKHGGKLLYQGTPEGLIDCEESLTAKYLKAKLI